MFSMDDELPPPARQVSEPVSVMEVPLQYMMRHPDLIPASDSPPAAAAAAAPAGGDGPLTSQGDTFVFFQAADGQFVVLHNLSLRMLLAEHHTIAQCPDTITADIVELETMVLTADQARRYRFLKYCSNLKEKEMKKKKKKTRKEEEKKSVCARGTPMFPDWVFLVLDVVLCCYIAYIVCSPSLCSLCL